MILFRLSSDTQYRAWVSSLPLNLIVQTKTTFQIALKLLKVYTFVCSHIFSDRNKVFPDRNICTKLNYSNWNNIWVWRTFCYGYHLNIWLSSILHFYTRQVSTPLAKHIFVIQPYKAISGKHYYISSNSITFHPTLLHFIQLYYISSSSIIFHLTWVQRTKDPLSSSTFDFKESYNSTL